MAEKAQQSQQPKTVIIQGVEVVFLGDPFATAVKAVEALVLLQQSGASTPSQSPKTGH